MGKIYEHESLRRISAGKLLVTHRSLVRIPQISYLLYKNKRKKEGERVLDVGPLVSSMKKRFKAIDTKYKRRVPCTICRILPSIREIAPGAYDPKIISIGPFHQGKQALQPMEQLKWQFLNDLIRRSPNNSLENYFRRISSLEPQARKCYWPPVTTNRDDFVETMVLDGCFIIEFLLKWYYADHDHQLYPVKWILPLLRNDLLLLENQLPFFVLQSLFSLSNIGDSVTLTVLAMLYLTSGKTDPFLFPIHIHHLLHLFHSTLRPNSVLESPEANTCIQPAMNATKKVKQVVWRSFLWLLSLFHYCRRPPPPGEKSRAPMMIPNSVFDSPEANTCIQPAMNATKKVKHVVWRSFLWLLSLFHYCRRPPPPGKKKSRGPCMIPNAVQLKEAGVKFKKKKARCFLDVGFINGTMEIPVLSIGDSAIPRFHNLIAFEQSCPTAANYFTSYVALMDNLIDKPEDVVLLEGCGILENMLGDEVEVSRFFNSLLNGARLNYGNHYLKDIFVEVENYCEVATHRWRAMLMHNYFSNPWAIISLVAATVLLILTALQTFYTVSPYYNHR